jgi:hypothetical protein
VQALEQGSTAFMCGRVERRPEREADCPDLEIFVGINAVVDCLIEWTLIDAVPARVVLVYCEPPL